MALEFSSGTIVTPRVSVLVPAYNAADYLERALNSALSQTMSSLEVIVVDDASNDATLAIACRVASRDPRVRVLRNERNGGVSVSRNRAIGTARGEWIALLDADDAWAPERLEQMLAVAENADVVSDDVCIVFSNSGKSVSRSLIQGQSLRLAKPKPITLLDFVQYDLGLLKPIIRRSFLNQHRLSYNPALCYAEDFRLYFEILSLGARWLQLPRGYYFYYKYAGSLTTSNLRSQLGKRMLWSSVIANTQSLLDHPATMGDAALAAALKHRIREARGHVIFATFWENLLQRRFSEISRSLHERPTEMLLITGYIANRIYLRIQWRIRCIRAGFLPPLGSSENLRIRDRVHAKE